MAALLQTDFGIYKDDSEEEGGKYYHGEPVLVIDKWNCVQIG